MHTFNVNSSECASSSGMRSAFSDKTLLNGFDHHVKAVHALNLSVDDSGSIIHGNTNVPGDEDVETAAK